MKEEPEKWYKHIYPTLEASQFWLISYFIKNLSAWKLILNFNFKPGCILLNFNKESAIYSCEVFKMQGTIRYSSTTSCFTSGRDSQNCSQFHWSFSTCKLFSESTDFIIFTDYCMDPLWQKKTKQNKTPQLFIICWHICWTYLETVWWKQDIAYR